jgi:hypothetical protein
MNRICFFLFAALLFNQQRLIAQTTWPREIPFVKTGGKVIIYQPQPDAVEGNTLTGRAAIAGKEKASDYQQIKLPVRQVLNRSKSPMQK